MELVVFDLDGTLLNKAARISPFTASVLQRMRQREIAYTIATGRTLHATTTVVQGHGFDLPHIYKNGVVIWRPREQRYSHQYLLSEGEIRHVLTAFMARDIAPFLFTIEPDGEHRVYHAPVISAAEKALAQAITHQRKLPLLPLAELPGQAELTNISALGPPRLVDEVAALVAAQPHLVAYTGVAMEDAELAWIDVHHQQGSKGAAVALLRQQLGIERVICFGDSDNDLSMFAEADECYAPGNALDEVCAAADQVIGHHDEDGVAKFLVQRFGL